MNILALILTLANFTFTHDDDLCRQSHFTCGFPAVYGDVEWEFQQWRGDDLRYLSMFASSNPTETITIDVLPRDRVECWAAPHHTGFQFSETLVITDCATATTTYLPSILR